MLHRDLSQYMYQILFKAILFTCILASIYDMLIWKNHSSGNDYITEFHLEDENITIKFLFHISSYSYIHKYDNTLLIIIN